MKINKGDKMNPETQTRILLDIDLDKYNDSPEVSTILRKLINKLNKYIGMVDELEQELLRHKSNYTVQLVGNKLFIKESIDSDGGYPIKLSKKQLEEIYSLF